MPCRRCSAGGGAGESQVSEVEGEGSLVAGGNISTEEQIRKLLS